MPDLYLSEIYIYPIKSLGGISVQQAAVEPRGLQHDRRWMLVDEAGQFLTQRQHAQMALLQVSLQHDGLLVSHKQGLLDPLYIPFVPEQGHSPHELVVQVWGDAVPALEVNSNTSAWFSKALGMPARLVRMAAHAQRPPDPDFAPPGEVVSFADDFPFLLIGQSSLNDLNSRIRSEHIPMNRFRPNLVFSGGEAFAEDSWVDFKIGEHAFSAAKPCARCVVTTINQQTAAKGKEPLKTLATYRAQNGKVMFGQNLLHRGGEGLLRIGDKLEVNTWKP